MRDLEEQTTNTIYGIETQTKSYDKYATTVDRSTKSQTDFRTATQRAIDVARILNQEQTNYARTEDIISEALAKHNSEQEKLNRNAEEYKEIIEEQEETMKEKALPTLQKMFSA